MDSDETVSCFEDILSLIGKVWDNHIKYNNQAHIYYEQAKIKMRNQELSSKDILKIRLLNTLLKYSEMFINYKCESLTDKITTISNKTNSIEKYKSYNDSKNDINESALKPIDNKFILHENQCSINVIDNSIYNLNSTKELVSSNKNTQCILNNLTNETNTIKEGNEYNNQENAYNIENLNNSNTMNHLNTQENQYDPKDQLLSYDSTSIHSSLSNSTYENIVNSTYENTVNSTYENTINSVFENTQNLSSICLNTNPEINSDGEQNSNTIHTTSNENLASISKRNQGECVTWNDIIGNNEAKQVLYESCIFPLLFSDNVFTGCRQISYTMLLYGPPGTGKTMLAKALAYESGRYYVELHPSTCISKWSGESEMRIKNIFNQCKTNSPSLIFIDELDSMTFTRSNNDDISSRRVLSELLIQFSSLKSQDNVYIIGATNRIEDLDNAILRRFQRTIYISLPSFEDRLEMITLFLKDIEHSLSFEDFQYIANITNGWNGSDLHNLVREASLLPLREIAQQFIYETNNSISKCKQDSSVNKIVNQSTYKRFKHDEMNHSETPQKSIATKEYNIRSVTFIDFLEALECINPSNIYQNYINSTKLQGGTDIVFDNTFNCLNEYSSRSKINKQKNG